MWRVCQGAVIVVNLIVIEGQANPLLTVASTAIGGIVGSNVGGGRGKYMGGALACMETHLGGRAF